MCKSWYSFFLTFFCIFLFSCEKKSSFEIVNDDLLSEIHKCMQDAKKAPEAYYDGNNITIGIEKRQDDIAITIQSKKANYCQNYIGKIKDKRHNIYLYASLKDDFSKLIKINKVLKCPFFEEKLVYGEKFIRSFTYKDGIFKKMDNEGRLYH